MDVAGVDVAGLELVVGYLASWAWRKARRIAGRADDEVDQIIDAGMDRVHDLVQEKLDGDPALARLESEAGEDLETESVSPRTRQRVLLALEDAVDTDEVFAGQLAELISDLRAASGGGTSVSAGDGSVVAAGDVRIEAPGGIAAGVIGGDATMGNPQSPGPVQA